jgi:heme A synthase
LRWPVWLTLTGILLQIVIAAVLVERNLPLLLRSLHEAVGTLIWLFVCWLSIVARRQAVLPAPQRTPVGATAAEVRA